MTTGDNRMNLDKLLKAKSVAVVGASEKSGFGGDTCRNILEYKKDLSRVYFVNPGRTQVFQRPCYPRLADVPDEIDLVIICTPRETVCGILKEASEKGCGGAVVFASGYSETGTEEGKKAEEELIRTGKELGIAILGPNCGGFNNYIDDVIAFAFPVEKRERKGHVGFLSQSGQFCINFMDSRDIRFSYAISVGNGKAVMLEDYLDYLIDDPKTKVIAVYMEGIQDAGRFAACLKKAALQRKPIVVQKGGRSAKGGKIAASHTGALAGSDRAYDAVFEKFGVIRVDDMQELLSMATFLSVLSSLPQKGNFASMNISGGETGICADMGSAYGIFYPDFEKKTLQRLKELLPDFATPDNPLDMTAALCYDSKRYAEGLKAVMEDEQVEMILIGITIAYEISDPTIYNIYDGVKMVLEQGYKKPIAILSFIEGTRNQEISEKFAALGVPILPSPKYAFSVIRHLQDYVSYRPEERTLRLAVSEQEKTGKRIALSERKSKEYLVHQGIEMELGMIASSPKEAVTLAEKMGYPVVMKVESDDILHKSDVGGVYLNLKDGAEVENTYDLIMRNVKQSAPEAKINGILIQPMMKKGLELVLGIIKDQQFGPMLLAGAGGVMVELYKDSVLYPVPINQGEAHGMLKKLNLYPLLKGYRGSSPCDMEAVENLMVQLSRMAEEKKEELEELDINPLFVYEKGVQAADALVVLQR